MSAYEFIPFVIGCLCAAFSAVALYPRQGWLGIVAGILIGVSAAALVCLTYAVIKRLMRKRRRKH
jgi:MFS family permease